MNIHRIIFITLIIGCISCSKVLDSGIEQTGDWSTALPENLGLDATPFKDMLTLLNQTPNHEIHSILVVKSGVLAFEQYFSGHEFQINAPNLQGAPVTWSAEKPHNVFSVTKSVASIIAGIAIDKGVVPDVQTKVFDLFPQHNDLKNANKDQITLEHLLTMSTGLEWDESSVSYTDPTNDFSQLFSVPDQVRHILSQPLVATPGSLFTYNGGCTNIVGEIIRKSAGKPTFDFGDEYLFNPLNITDYSWSTLPSSQEFTAADLYLRPRDMAKLGYLYLNNGMWNGQQIVSQKWVEQSTKVHLPTTPSFPTFSGYGYQWWIHNFDAHRAFLALGWGGQVIAVFRDLDLVVVITAGNQDKTPPINPFTLIQNYILPATR